MSIEKLKELRACEEKAGRLVSSFGGLLILAFFAMVIHSFAVGQMLKAIIVGIYVIAIFILLVITIYFGFKEVNYSNKLIDVILSILKQFLQSEGIPKEAFKLIWDETNHEYLLAFHNQKIDYNILDKKVQELIYLLNKVAKKNVKVKLI